MYPDQRDDCAPMPVYAGFWARVAAVIVDGVITQPPGLVLSYFGVLPESNVTLVIGVLLGWIYYAGMESSKWQGRLGYKVLGLKVVDGSGERISFARASVRHLGRLISIFTLGIGNLMVCWTKRKQALHDKIAGTFVVRS